MKDIIAIAASLAALATAVMLITTFIAWLLAPHNPHLTSDELICPALIGIGFAILAVRR